MYHRVVWCLFFFISNNYLLGFSSLFIISNKINFNTFQILDELLISTNTNNIALYECVFTLVYIYIMNKYRNTSKYKTRKITKNKNKTRKITKNKNKTRKYSGGVAVRSDATRKAYGLTDLEILDISLKQRLEAIKEKFSDFSNAVTETVSEQMNLISNTSRCSELQKDVIELQNDVIELEEKRNELDEKLNDFTVEMKDKLALLKVQEKNNKEKNNKKKMKELLKNPELRKQSRDQKRKNNLPPPWMIEERLKKREEAAAAAAVQAEQEARLKAEVAAAAAAVAKAKAEDRLKAEVVPQ
jgi:hypothetical protein